MKFSESDLRILRAALVFGVEGDDDAWSDLTPEDMERAEEILETLNEEVGEPEEDWLDDEDDDEDAEDDEDEWEN
jgi:hypothetical protein